ncbi:hypothetical protein KDK_06080 [Dictyobacter kobayashii]|uniref:Uncharacterized protein n=1 Tax=Dictyobacter kobayashii TaxID=2014872 RepID=A0A402ACK1_9CHLR|nr:hypothetical protein KDK_06080 [Dictyobacter kobayashii]
MHSFALVMLLEVDATRAGLWIGLGCLSLPIEFLVAYIKYGSNGSNYLEDIWEQVRKTSKDG